MLEQIDTRLEQQDKQIKELMKLVQEQTELSRQDHLKVTQLEQTVLQWKQQLQNELSTAFQELHHKLDEITTNVVSHETSALVEMYQRLTAQQDTVCATILGLFEQKFKVQTDALKRISTPDDNVVQNKLAKLDIGSLGLPGTSKDIVIKTEKPDSKVAGKMIGVIQGTSNPRSESMLTSHANGCYSNWVQKHNPLTKLEFVPYKELDSILAKVLSKGKYEWGDLRNSLTPDDMSAARKSIQELQKAKLDKYQRFPAAGCYVDIYVNSAHNVHLKQLLSQNDRDLFYKSTENYKSAIRNNAPDQISFESANDLQWSVASI